MNEGAKAPFTMTHSCESVICRFSRRGKPVARLTAVDRPRKPIDAALLRSLTAVMPPQAEGTADLVRSMRDGDRY